MTVQKDKPQPKIPNSVIILMGCLAGYFIVTEFSGTPSRKYHSKKQTPPPLEVLSQSCSTEHGYIFVTGEVKNISSAPLNNVMAVGTFRTKDGEFIKTAEALIDYNPIMPQQSSPFKAGTSANPLIKDCYVTFKSIFGKRIPVKYNQQ